MGIIEKVRRHGIRDSVRILKNRIIGTEPEANINPLQFYGYTLDTSEIPFRPEDAVPSSRGIIVNWIIPEMDKGSGGHINIFRFVTMLENRGIHNRIYVDRSPKFLTDEAVREFVAEHYDIGNPKVELFHDSSEMKFAHATIATGWHTAYCLRRFQNTLVKYYFVQDFEPYFYPIGTEYFLAENTYRFGFRGITAGDWLKTKLHSEYGMNTESVGFSFDRKLYHPVPKRDDTKRVFFYARPVTPRRAFELGLLAITELKRRMPEVEVVFAGWELSRYEIPFEYTSHGTLSLDKLADLYGQCDLCLVMSTTNLSLLPLEVMASGSVIVCSAGSNNSWLLNEQNSVVVDYDPLHIADRMEYYLNHPEELAPIREAGRKTAEETSWEKEGEKLYQYLLKGVAENEKN